MTDKQLLIKILTNISDETKAEQKAKDMKASGKSAASLRVEASENQLYADGALLGSDYFEFQRDGRGPTKKRKKKGFFQEIVQWIQDKGIRPRDNISKKSLAFLIYRKINRDGTDVFLGERKGLDMNKIFKRNLLTLNRELSAKKSFDYQSSIFKRLKEELEG